MMKRTVLSLGLAGLSAMLAGTAQAGMLLNESFNYADGTALTSTGNWTATSGTTLPITVNSSTITVTNLSTTGATGEDDRNTFSTAGITTGTVYYSFLVTAPTTDTSLTLAAGDYFFSAVSSAGSFEGRIFLNKTTTGYAFGLSNGSSSPANDSADITLGTQYKLVLRVDVAAKTTTMGVFATNVTPTADTDLNISGGTTVGSAANITGVQIRQGGATGAAFTTVIDGIQVGTTLGDVSGITTGTSPYFNAVPEPSTYAAFAMGVLALLGVQRMRRRTV